MEETSTAMEEPSKEPAKEPPKEPLNIQEYLTSKICQSIKGSPELLAKYKVPIGLNEANIKHFPMNGGGTLSVGGSSMTFCNMISPEKKENPRLEAILARATELRLALINSIWEMLAPFFSGAGEIKPFVTFELDGAISFCEIYEIFRLFNRLTLGSVITGKYSMACQLLRLAKNLTQELICAAEPLNGEFYTLLFYPYGIIPVTTLPDNRLDVLETCISQLESLFSSKKEKIAITIAFFSQLSKIIDSVPFRAYLDAEDIPSFPEKSKFIGEAYKFVTRLKLPKILTVDNMKSFLKKF